MIPGGAGLYIAVGSLKNDPGDLALLDILGDMSMMPLSGGDGTLRCSTLALYTWRLGLEVSPWGSCSGSSGCSLRKTPLLSMK